MCFKSELPNLTSFVDRWRMVVWRRDGYVQVVGKCTCMRSSICVSDGDNAPPYTNGVHMHMLALAQVGMLTRVLTHHFHSPLLNGSRAGSELRPRGLGPLL